MANKELTSGIDAAKKNLGVKLREFMEEFHISPEELATQMQDASKDFSGVVTVYRKGLAPEDIRQFEAMADHMKEYSPQTVKAILDGKHDFSSVLDRNLPGKTPLLLPTQDYLPDLYPDRKAAGAKNSFGDAVEAALLVNLFRLGAEKELGESWYDSLTKIMALVNHLNPAGDTGRTVVDLAAQDFPKLVIMRERLQEVSHAWAEVKAAQAYEQSIPKFSLPSMEKGQARRHVEKFLHANGLKRAEFTPQGLQSIVEQTKENGGKKDPRVAAEGLTALAIDSLSGNTIREDISPKLLGNDNVLRLAGYFSKMAKQKPDDLIALVDASTEVSSPGTFAIMMNSGEKNMDNYVGHVLAAHRNPPGEARDIAIADLNALRESTIDAMHQIAR